MIQQERDKRSLILDGSEELFATKGYALATIDEIAANAGVAKGTIYLYFRDKQDLFISLIEERLQEFMELARSSVAGASSVEQWLQTLIQVEIDFIKGHIGLVDPMFQSLATRPEEVQNRIRRMRREIEGCMAESLRQIVGNRMRFAPHLALTMIFGAVNALVIHYLENDLPLVSEEIAAMVMTLVMPGLIMPE